MCRLFNSTPRFTETEVRNKKSPRKALSGGSQTVLPGRLHLIAANDHALGRVFVPEATFKIHGISC